MGSQEEKFTVSEQEWQDRRLCPDESCIGVIGKDGHCKECGLLADPQGAAGAVPAVDAGIPAACQPAGDAPASAADADPWADRRLCSDGNCIGVIGADGRCKECGKPYTGEPQ